MLSLNSIFDAFHGEFPVKLVIFPPNFVKFHRKIEPKLHEKKKYRPKNEYFPSKIIEYSFPFHILFPKIQNCTLCTQ